jgi:hypothetical protein
MKKITILFLLFMFCLAGCVEVKVSLVKKVSDGIVRAYPDPCSDIRLMKDGAYPYPISY